MKTLVAFYSRTGNTEKIGKLISKNINADIDTITDMKNRTRRIIGWLISGKDASQKSLTKIKYKKDPSKYDLVIIGTPIWSWTLTPAIRTYLTENNGKFKKVAFFCTSGGNKGKAFEEMKNLSKKPIATLEIRDKDVRKGHLQEELLKFCRKLGK